MTLSNATIKTEITTDPRGYGYAAPLALGSYDDLANILNTVRDGTNIPPAITGVNRGSVSTQDMIEAIVESEYVALSQAQRDYLALVAAGTRVRVDTASTSRAGMLAIFGSGTVTRTNMSAVSVRNGSRAEELNGVANGSYSVTVDQVRTAMLS